MIPFELYLASTPFCDATILTYEIKLPPSGKKVSFDLLYDEDFTIPCITDTTPNSPYVRQIQTQVKRNVCIRAINSKEPITAQGSLDELNCHQNPREKSKVDISLCRIKNYQRTDLEDICSRFDQVITVVSHLVVSLPKKPPTPKNIGKGLKVPQIQLCKEALFVQYDKNKSVSLLPAPTPIKSLPDVKKVIRSLIAHSALFQPKISPKLSFSGMYRKSFIYCRNSTNSQ